MEQLLWMLCAIPAIVGFLGFRLLLWNDRSGFKNPPEIVDMVWILPILVVGFFLYALYEGLRWCKVLLKRWCFKYVAWRTGLE